MIHRFAIVVVKKFEVVDCGLTSIIEGEKCIKLTGVLIKIKKGFSVKRKNLS